MRFDARPTERDSLLIKAFQEGNREAFDGLVLKHKDRVFNLCYWFLGDYQEANDIAQETFIKVFRSLKAFRFESAFTTWLYRIAVNTCRNRLKSAEYRRKRKMVRIDNPGEENPSGPHSELKDESLSPLNSLERKEKIMAIREAIHSLPGIQKEVVTLRDIEGFSYEEIAQVTGLNLGTVKSRLARARLDLKERLRSVINYGV